MTHRKRIERLEENIRVLYYAAVQERHNKTIRDYLTNQIDRLQNKYQRITGNEFVFNPEMEAYRDFVEEDSAWKQFHIK